MTGEKFVKRLLGKSDMYFNIMKINGRTYKVAIEPFAPPEEKYQQVDADRWIRLFEERKGN